MNILNESANKYLVRKVCAEKLILAGWKKILGQRCFRGELNHNPNVRANSKHNCEFAIGGMDDENTSLTAKCTNCHLLLLLPLKTYSDCVGK